MTSIYHSRSSAASNMKLKQRLIFHLLQKVLVCDILAIIMYIMSSNSQQYQRLWFYISSKLHHRDSKDKSGLIIINKLPK